MGNILEMAGVPVEIDATPPEMNLAPRAVEGLLEEVQWYHMRFSPLFRREEQRYWSRKYLEGLLLEIPNKAIEPMAERLEGGNVRAMQQFIGAGAWDDRAILTQHQRLVDEALGEPNGVLIVDDSGFPKQGEDSVGVKHQWCGNVGKVAKCQVGVFVGYTSSQGYTLVDHRLYMPEDWFSDAYAERRRKCGVPEDLPFHTKPQIAWQLLEPIITEQRIRFRWVTMDEGYSKEPQFLDHLDQAGAWYLAEVACDTRVWQERPMTHVPPPSPRGRPPSKERVVPEAPEPQRVDVIAAGLSPADWTPYRIKEGSKGPMVAEFAFLRVIPVRDGLPGRDQWLVLRRGLENTPTCKYFLSNAAADSPEMELVRVSAMRWPVETSIEEGKGEVGMDDYQTRSWCGWHHHMTMTLLAHFFLVRLRLKFKDSAPALTVPQVRLLLQVVLPKKAFDAQEVLDLVRRMQYRHHAAYLSHRKRKIQRLDGL
jgi:SRSO17 transposase